MADEKAFSHITVSTDDEDDLVIQAGARAASRLAPATPEPTPVEPEPAATSAEAVSDEPVAADPDETMAEGAGEGDAVPVSGGARREDELEDLKSAPMSRIQKAVLAVALLFIVAFAVYYIFLY